MDRKEEAAAFTTKLDAEVTALNELIDSNNANARDDVRLRIVALDKAVTDAALFLPQYDLRHALAAIAQLNSKMATEKDKTRSKFSFASRSKKSTSSAKNEAVPTSAAVVAAAADTTSTPALLPSSVVSASEETPANATVLRDLTNTFINPTPESTSDKNSTEVYLLNLKHCVVDLRQISPIGALHIKNIESCVLLCGGIMGSLLSDNIQNSCLVAACRQFRMHTSANTRILLHVSSHPIIEDCQTLVFGPYTPRSISSGSDDTLDSPFPWIHIVEKAGLGTDEGSAGRWMRVEDFNWLKKTASPNWRAAARGESKVANDDENGHGMSELTVRWVGGDVEATLKLNSLGKVL
ncbi:hypothetical protein HDU78_007075 [Chytriomyces hyalinus]|nr:hypothetical protein HDU78_007075 [Chytriomyces hyalinus]KAJ3267258.1 hypothetical protein HDU77_003338 [Chytriomyces hyalinus]